MLKIHKNTLFDIKKVLIVLTLLVALLLALLTYSNVRNREAADYTNQITPAPAVLSDEDAKNKEEFINEDYNPKQNQNVSSSDNQISAIVENGELTVSSKLYSISDGDCQLVVKNGTQKITRAAQVIYQPTYSTCAGFSIDKSEFSNGTWDIILTIKPVEGTDEILRTAVDINSEQ